MSAKFENRGEDLYVDDHRVIKVYESWSGWYWFATEEAEPGLYFGFVQGFEEEWGYFSKEELEALKPKVWTVPKRNWSYTGKR